MNEPTTIHCGDMLEILPTLGRVDLVITSPPYEDARTYGISFKLKGDAWVQWAADRFMACLEVCRGPVCWVVAGRTRGYQWSATPPALMVELARRGAVLRNPCIYERDGIPGSGGPDWFKSRFEWIVCATTKRGRLPWSDSTAMGHPCRFPIGGAMSNRNADGRRINQAKHGDATGNRASKRRPGYLAPKLANPGNIIDCGPGGGGHLGSKLAHENEAPFPERIPEWFIRSCCPPGGVVLDPFCGSGTTLAVAKRLGRVGIGIDIRESQCELTRRRLAETEAA